jgi:hypothetical protein
VVAGDQGDTRRTQLKRVVAGINEHGQTYVISTEELPATDFRTVWTFDPSHVPGRISATDPELAANWLRPGIMGGMRWLFVPLRPDAELEYPKVPGIDENGFHTTRTIDFDDVIDGEPIVVLDEGPVQLHKGDCVIQRGCPSRMEE